MRRPTIIDVAKHAGVSWKTVSRVVNREPGVREETAARVEAAIAALSYRRNSAARSLGAERTFLIGIVTIAFSAQYSVALCRGAAEICRDRGYHLVVECLPPCDGDLIERFDHMLRSVDFQGVIVPPPLCNEPGVIRLLARYGVEAVLIDPSDHDTDFPFVDVDDAAGIRQLVTHAVEQGHRTFAMVDGPEKHCAAERRRDAFHEAVRRHGGRVVDHEPGSFTFDSGFAAGQRLFAKATEATFVFAANDDMAAGVIAAAGQAGLRVPDHVSIAGFDDSDVALLVWPPLTTLRQPIAAIAAAAVDMLTCPASERTIVRQPFDVTLVARGSTAQARMMDRR